MHDVRGMCGGDICCWCLLDRSGITVSQGTMVAEARAGGHDTGPTTPWLMFSPPPGSCSRLNAPPTFLWPPESPAATAINLAQHIPQHTHITTPQHTSAHLNTNEHTSSHTSIRLNVPQYTSAYLNTPQYTSIHLMTSQRTQTQLNTLQRNGSAQVPP